MRFLIPEGGVSGLDAPGKPFWDPAADRALFDAIAGELPRRRRPQARPPAASRQRRGVRRRAGRRVPRDRGAPASAAARASHAEPTMPRIARQDLLDEFRAHDRARRADHRRRRRHRPVGEVRGGRRHRPHRHLQLRPLPHGRARLARRPARLRQRERDRARDGARGAAGGASTRRCSPASTAPTRSCSRDDFLRRLADARLLRRAELPDRRPHRRRVPRQPRGDRHGLRRSRST